MKKFLNWLKGPSSDFILFIVLLVLINIAGQKAFVRFDLTEPKSYSISKASANIVKRTFHGKTTIKLEEPTAEFIYTRKSEKHMVYPYSKLNNSLLSNYKTYYDKHKKIVTSMSDKIKVKEI